MYFFFFLPSLASFVKGNSLFLRNALTIKWLSHSN